MQKLMFSLKDEKAVSWSQPFASENKATAMRDFQSLVSDGRTLVGQHPEDFNLFEVGYFDTVTGVLDGEPPIHVANGADFVRKD